MTKAQPDDLDAVRKIVEALDGFESGDQERIVRWAREKVGLETAPAPTGAAPPSAQPSLERSGLSSTTSFPDIKSFIEAKNPRSNNQFAAAVAYYYQFEAPTELHKESITAEDLQEACRLVGRERLKHPAQTLVDAQKQGSLDRGDRGAYTINTVGENLVAMTLPAQSARPQSRKPARKAKLNAQASAKKR